MPTVDPLDVQVANAKKRRNKLEQQVQEYLGLGWRFLDDNVEHLVLKSAVQKSPPPSSLAWSHSPSKSDIFMRIWSPELVRHMLWRIATQHKERLVRHHGSQRKSQMTVSMQLCFDFFAIRTYIQGKQLKKGTVRSTIAHARNALQELTGKTITGYRKLETFNGLVDMEPGSTEVLVLDKNFRSCIGTTGQVFAADEKLFRFTGRHLFVRMVKTKPSRIGIWFYQGVVILRNTLPFLMTTRAHFLSEDGPSKIVLADVIDDWTSIASKDNNGCITVMDSYYLSREACHRLRESNKLVLAACNKNRFAAFDRMLSKEAKAPGSTKFAHNPNTGESFTYHNSIHKEIGKKLVYSNAFEVKSGKRPNDHRPLYDEYKVSFDGCDRFNFALTGKTWPFRAGGGGVQGFNSATFDYLFSSSLVNAHHAYLASMRGPTAHISFEYFCTELAKELTEIAQQLPTRHEG